MKKRAKIITTIASLCLAVALMAFGVYAATQVGFGVTSKVKFEVIDVFVTIAGDTKLSTNANPTTYSVTPTDQYTEGNTAGYTKGVSFDSVRSFAGTIGTNATILTGLKDTNGTGDPFTGWDAGEMNLTSTNPGVQYTITITNNSPDASCYVATDKIAGLASAWTGTTSTVSSTYSVTTASTPVTGTLQAKGGDGADKNYIGFKPAEGAWAQTVEVGYGKVLTITYTFTVTDYSKNQSATVLLDDVKFGIGHDAEKALNAIAQE